MLLLKESFTSGVVFLLFFGPRVRCSGRIVGSWIGFRGGVYRFRAGDLFKSGWFLVFLTEVCMYCMELVYFLIAMVVSSLVLLVYGCRNALDWFSLNQEQ